MGYYVGGYGPKRAGMAGSGARRSSRKRAPGRKKKAGRRHRGGKLKFGSPAYRRKYLGHR